VRGIRLTSLHWEGRDEPLDVAPAPIVVTPDALVHGDNAPVLSALPAESVDLVYLDPPYGLGQSFATEGGDHAYADTWGGGLDAYVPFVATRLRLLHRVLRPTGHLFLHCDWRADAHLRLVLDHVFDADAYRNTITWRRAPNLGRQAASAQLGRVTDTIFVYSKVPGSPFPGPPPARSEAVPVDRNGNPKGARWDEAAGAWFTTAPRGDYTDASVERLRAEGRIHDSATGGISVKYFLRAGGDGRWYKDQRVDCLWDDAEVRPLRHAKPAERLGYPTQKPESLLTRIVTWASVPGQVVLDPFCGSGTTAAVAQKLGRRWLAIDASPAAIAVASTRLGVEPVVV
jgi:adenine-specific DNA-methyltransferase